MTSAQLIPSLDKLASQATADIGGLLRRAYEMGREDMRQELMNVLSPKSSDMAMRGETPLVVNTSTRTTSKKAPPGTVRPAILAMIESSQGLLTEQILSSTGFKENSVRGTLSTLQKEGKIERSSGRWIRKSEGPAAEAARPS